MGYSARYHATSLIAVFLALAIGILIGAEFGGSALNNTRRDLERSLVGNLQDARSRADQLSGELGRADEFAERVYPVLVRNRLAGKRIAILALGGLPGNVSSAIETALGPTGARLVGVGVVREPVDLRSLAADLSKTRFADVVRNPEAQTALGAGIGRQLVRGGSLLELVRSSLFSQASGNFGRLDGVIVVRDQPEGMGPVQRAHGGAAGVGADAGDHGDPDAGGRGRDLHGGTVLGLLLPRQCALQRRRRRHGRGAGGADLRDAGGGGQLRHQGERRPPAAGPAGARALSRSCTGSASRSRSRWRWLLVPAGARGLAEAGLVRENYRGAKLAFPLGAVLATAALVALAPLAFLNDRADLELLDPELRRWIPYVIGVAFLGFLDDSLGGGEEGGAPRGWRGHARALREGRLSTGAIKAIGALALAAYVVSGRGLESWRYLADVALLILATNLFNLLDLRPGRAEKGLALLGAGLCLGAWTLAPLELLGIFAGPVLVGAWLTLRERAMLGDTGSNLIGAIAGVWLLTTLGGTGRLIALGAVVLLTIYGEMRSISATIESVPPLRWLDSLGRG